MSPSMASVNERRKLHFVSLIVIWSPKIPSKQGLRHVVYQLFVLGFVLQDGWHSVKQSVKLTATISGL